MSQAAPEKSEHEEDECKQISIGPGGLIASSPQNRRLIEAIERAEPLGPETLLTIGESFKLNPTNVAVGNHFNLLALAADDERIQRVFTEYANFSLYDAIEDGLEFPHAKDDPDDPEKLNKKRRFTAQLTVRQIDISEIGAGISGIPLLIETITIQSFPDEESITGHFVIGVNPGPVLVDPDPANKND